MGLFLKRLILFLLFCSAIYVCLIGIWGYLSTGKIRSNVSYQRGAYGHMYTRLKEVKGTENVDIVFLGSSHSYRGFDTRIFKRYGYSSFNLGSSSQTPAQSKVLVQRYLKQLNPKIVIYEVYPTTLLVDGTESALDLISNGEIDSYALNMIFKVNALKVYNTFIYAVIHNILHIDSYFVEPKLVGNDQYVPGGYVEQAMVQQKPNEIHFGIHHSLQPENFETFNSTLKVIAEESNSKVILVYAPITFDLYRLFLDRVEYNNALRKYGAYYNFNEQPIFNDSLHFYDAQHLNQTGVQIFNEALIERLKIESLL